MGRLIGSAVTMEGDIITVTFSGDSVADGELERIVSVTLQMDGDAEYTPIKITTASIGLLVDGVELMSMAAGDTPVVVAVDNTRTQRTLFRGYVVPNSYNQQLLGINDLVTIECVDWLGYSKYIPYEQVDASAGFAALKLGDIAVRCIRLAGGAGRREKVMFPQNVGVYRASYRVGGISELIASEEYCFNSNMPDEDTWNYRPVAMSCEEVLSMIAESFRLTWVSDGTDVYLVDMLSATMGDVEYRDEQTGDTVVWPIAHDVDEESFIDVTSNVSTLPRVQMTEVVHHRADKIPLLQNPFEVAYLRKDGDYKEYYNAAEDAYNRVIALPLRSVMYDTHYVVEEGATEPTGCHSMFVGWCDNKSVVPSPGSAHFLENYAWGSGQWNVALKISDEDGEVPLVPMLRRKVEYSTVAVGEPRGAVDTAARMLSISASVCAPKEYSKENRARLWPKDAENIDCKLLVSVLVDGMYYRPDYTPGEDSYTDEVTVFGVDVYKDGTAHWDIYGLYDKEQDGIPVPSAGVVELIIYNRGARDDLGWKVAWLKSLELVIKSDTYALREDLLRPSVTREGTWDFNRTQQVELPLDMYYRLSDKPLRAPSGNSAVNARLEYVIAGESVDISAYAHRLANMGDRLMYELSLRDEANAMTPLDVFTCALWSGRKAMAGYARDLLNNTINVTLV